LGASEKPFDVVQLSTVHPPRDVRIFQKISRSLADAGYRTMFVVRDDADTLDSGVSIKALPRNVGRFGRMFGLTFRAFREALRSGAPVVHFHDPELMPIGIVLKLLGKTVIYDAHEDHHRTIATKYYLPTYVRIVAARGIWILEWITARTVDRVIAATPTIAKRFPAGKTVIVQNYPRMNELALDEGERRNDEATVVYVGAVTPERGGVEMTKAVNLVDPTYNLTLRIAGEVVPESHYRQLIEIDKNKRLDLLGHSNRAVVREMMRSARAGLVTLHPHPNYVNALATKMFEYMSAGVPVIASNFPLWRQILQSTGAGLVVDPLKPEEIRQAIEYVLSHPEEARSMGERGRAAVRERFNWEIEERKLLNVYAGLNCFRRTNKGIEN